MGELIPIAEPNAPAHCSQCGAVMEGRYSVGYPSGTQALYACPTHPDRTATWYSAFDFWQGDAQEAVPATAEGNH